MRPHRSPAGLTPGNRFTIPGIPATDAQMIDVAMVSQRTAAVAE